MIIPKEVFNKCSPEGQQRIMELEKMYYENKCEQLLIDMQLKQLDKMNWRSFWE